MNLKLPELHSLQRSTSDPNFPPSVQLTNFDLFTAQGSSTLPRPAPPNGHSPSRQYSYSPDQRDRDRERAPSNGHSPRSYSQDEYEAENLKRKRDDEAWERRVSRKLNDERNSIKERHDKAANMNKDLFRLYNDLQGIRSEYALFVLSQYLTEP